MHVFYLLGKIISPLCNAIFNNSVKLSIAGPYIGEEERIRHDALFYSQNPEDGLLLSGKKL